MNIEDAGSVRFPVYAGHIINMMPIVMGDSATLPAELHGCGRTCGWHGSAMFRVSTRLKPWHDRLHEAAAGCWV